MVPDWPTATNPPGNDSTDESNAVVGVLRLVHPFPSVLVKMTPPSPLTINWSPKAATPWRSALTGGGTTASQETPKVLTWLVLRVPSVLVITTLVSSSALPTTTARLVLPPTPRKMELVAESAGSSWSQLIPSRLLRTVARSPTAR